eukprot:scaffold74364_cov39-Phaeocystis_antarctica.AAC.2
MAGRAAEAASMSAVACEGLGKSTAAPAASSVAATRSSPATPGKKGGSGGMPLGVGTWGDVGAGPRLGVRVRRHAARLRPPPA